MFPDIDKKMLANAHTLWKNENDAAGNSSDANSLRQNVFDFLKQNPQTTLGKIEKAFPDFNKKTVSNYLDQWRKDHTPKRKESLKQQITEYMDTNPKTDLRQLREVFHETKPASVNTYFSLWKNDHIQADGKKEAKVECQSKIRNSDNEIVSALKTTIDAQSKTIEALKSQNEILRDRQVIAFPELETMTSEEVATVEKVIRTFIRGIKSV
ncbi:MAG: hypothetical protein HQ517_00910 [SAR324 cluster bacterium]|nr:hypothetical protein [SAR324 cluster bacterium]